MVRILQREALFRDRRDAGRQLAAKLVSYRDRPDVLVLALPRGGVPVAFEVARALKAPLDVFLVRKVGVPGYEELAMGAIATGGAQVLNDTLIERLSIPPQAVEASIAREQRELARREQLYRDGPKPDVRGKTVILVDDGLATGSTMQVAIKALRQMQPARIVMAVPIAPPESCAEMAKLADDVMCAATPAQFGSVGRWYDDFGQTSDDEVRMLLAEAKPPVGERSLNKADRALVEAIRIAAEPLTGSLHDYDPLLKWLGEARFALLGEASHGTHEFYQERAEITKRLITEKGFTAVAVEADWPDADRVNRYVQGRSGDLDAAEALSDFRRFPTWMWRNTVMVDFVEWLREHNDALPSDARKVGFYGLDLYSLHASMKAVLQYLDRADPAAARRARQRYACFGGIGEDAQNYGLLTRLDLSKSCEQEAIAQLVEMQRLAGDPNRHPDHFFAEQNARLVKNAESYYRTMYLGRASSWNLRDQHMAETLDALEDYLSRGGSPAKIAAKIAVWAHNSHLGDARTTDMSRRGELNVGQLVRERYGGDCMLIGFTTHHGAVTAASDWGEAAERKRVRPALEGSYETLFHEVGTPRFLIVWSAHLDVAEQLRAPRLERAIGVIYRPETERLSHYFKASLPDQFDAVLHFDETRAVTPLERTASWEAGEMPETYPFAV
ncbi:MAG TPA: erythromycin esterase family protein [Dongiaceae bacterium]|nr:erythromycin esterase family protein [Dongiaceae bacterium]